MINFFFFTRRERLGSVALLVFCAGIFAVPNIREYFFHANSTDFSRFESQIQAFKAAETPDSIPLSSRELFEFDPNEASEADFLKLGLPAKVATSICHYREKGGQFRQPDDFKKIWGLLPADFERLKPFIKIQNAPGRKYDHEDSEEGSPRAAWGGKYAEHQGKESYKKHTPESVDINSADQEAWMALPMIGEKRAAQIIHFRENLGGFQSVEQLAEMYNLPDSVFQTIKPFLRLESPVFRKINLNTATLEMLDAHPYISRKQAELIVNYREQHGKYLSIDDILKIRVFREDDWWNRLKPYLTVD